MADEPNTDAQKAMHEAQEAAWEDQKSWPVWRVFLSGDETEHVPRKNPLYWKPVDENNPDGPWEPIDGKPVMLKRTAKVTCKARTEDEAKMYALRDNPEFHTVESVTQLEV